MGVATENVHQMVHLSREPSARACRWLVLVAAPQQPTQGALNTSLRRLPLITGSDEAVQITPF